MDFGFKAGLRYRRAHKRNFAAEPAILEPEPDLGLLQLIDLPTLDSAVSVSGLSERPDTKNIEMDVDFDFADAPKPHKPSTAASRTALRRMRVLQLQGTSCAAAAHAAVVEKQKKDEELINALFDALNS